MEKNIRLKITTALLLLETFLFNGVLPVFAAEKKALTVVKTYSRKDCSLAPWIIAQKKGFLEKEGIEASS